MSILKIKIDAAQTSNEFNLLHKPDAKLTTIPGEAVDQVDHKAIHCHRVPWYLLLSAGNELDQPNNKISRGLSAASSSMSSCREPVCRKSSIRGCWLTSSTCLNLLELLYNPVSSLAIGAVGLQLGKRIHRALSSGLM